MGWRNHRETTGPQGCVSAKVPLHNGQGHKHSGHRTIPKEHCQEKPEDPGKLSLPQPSRPRRPPSPIFPGRGKWTSSLLARAENVIRFRLIHTHVHSAVNSEPRKSNSGLTQRPKEKPPQLQSRAPAQSHHLLRLWLPGRAIKCAST